MRVLEIFACSGGMAEGLRRAGLHVTHAVTTVTADDRIAAPGHHSGSFLSDPNAIVLSERARLILQGFPASWHIAGTTKAKRSAAIGMAMPPPLAEAVGRQIAAWLRATAERRCA